MIQESPTLRLGSYIMSKPLLIGITGGIGSGKSTVAAIFNLLGIPVYNADVRARVLMNEEEQLISDIKERFGEQSYDNGLLNREYLAKRIFASEEETNKLNQLVHPAVARDFENWSLSQQTKYIVKEAALLFETGSYKELDKTILVVAPESTRIKRVLKRDSNRSAEQINNIIERQTSVEKVKPLASWIIKNDDSELIIPQVLRIHAAIKN